MNKVPNLEGNIFEVNLFSKWNVFVVTSIVTRTSFKILLSKKVAKKFPELNATDIQRLYGENFSGHDKDIWALKLNSMNEVTKIIFMYWTIYYYYYYKMKGDEKRSWPDPWRP